MIIFIQRFVVYIRVRVKITVWFEGAQAVYVYCIYCICIYSIQINW